MQKNNTAKQRRDWLARSLRTHLLPVLVKQGFEVVPRRSLPPPVDRELVRCFPEWGQLIRARGDDVDLIEIQFSSDGRAAFRINAGGVPKTGLMNATGHRSPDEVCVHWLEEFFETHARPWLRPVLRILGLEPLGAWFSVWRWPHRSPEQEDYERLAMRAASVVPELELALREGKLGPHVRRVALK